MTEESSIKSLKVTIKLRTKRGHTADVTAASSERATPEQALKSALLELFSIAYGEQIDISDEIKQFQSW